MSRADIRVYTTLTDGVPFTSYPLIEDHGGVRIGDDLSIFGSADNLTRLAVALLAAANPQGDPT